MSEDNLTHFFAVKKEKGEFQYSFNEASEFKVVVDLCKKLGVSEIVMSVNGSSLPYSVEVQIGYYGCMFRQEYGITKSFTVEKSILEAIPIIKETTKLWGEQFIEVYKQHRGIL